jgi:hypothetical protein
MDMGNFNTLFTPQANQVISSATQALSPFLPLPMQAPVFVQPVSPYDNASQHFKAGAYPFMGDSGAPQANTGLFYLTDALKNDQQRNLQNTQMIFTALNLVQRQNAEILDLLQQNRSAANPQSSSGESSLSAVKSAVASSTFPHASKSHQSGSSLNLVG